MTDMSVWLNRFYGDDHVVASELYTLLAPVTSNFSSVLYDREQ